jgi:hypothetical protein
LLVAVAGDKAWSWHFGVVESAKHCVFPSLQQQRVTNSMRFTEAITSQLPHSLLLGLERATIALECDRHDCRDWFMFTSSWKRLMHRVFRKYHRWLATILCLPLVTTILSGMGYTIADEWLHQEALGKVFMSIHTFKMLNLEAIFPLLNGLSLIGLLVTGLSLSGLFPNRNKTKSR